MNYQTNHLSCLLLLLMTFASGFAADKYDRYYENLPVEMAKVSPVVIPQNEVNIKDFGGVGDGLFLNTDAFKKAISALTKKGGGRLLVPQGVWLTGPILMKSNVELHVQKNAIILFSPDKSLFVDPDGKSTRCYPGIRATKQQNIAITGAGIIDGNGAQWRPVKRGKVSDVEWKRFAAIGGEERAQGSLWYPWNVKAGYPNIADTPEAQEKKRADLLRFTECENILIEGVTFQNSPRFHVHPVNCRNVIIDGITVRCPWNAQNGDASDLGDCYRALVVNSTVDAGDDGICMKSGKTKPQALVNGCEDILIQDNTVYHAHGGFVIGSEDVSGMKRIVVRQCRFSGTDTGLRFKSGIGRGGKTQDIYISDIVMNDIADEAVIFQCDYVDRPAGSSAKKAASVDAAKAEYVPEFTDIHISNVVCRGTRTAIRANGIEGFSCVHGITLSNSTFIYTEAAAVIDAKTVQLELKDVKMVKDGSKL